MVRRLLVLGLTAIAVLTCAAPPQDPAEYNRAETAALDVSSWKDLHAWFTRYAAYDDGQIAVMNDGFVELQLSRHWESLPELAKEADRDGEFLRFVLGHLNEGTGCEARRKILASAGKEHRPKLGPLSLAIAAKLRERAPQECLP